MAEVPESVRFVYARQAPNPFNWYTQDDFDGCLITWDPPGDEEIVGYVVFRTSETLDDDCAFDLLEGYLEEEAERLDIPRPVVALVDDQMHEKNRYLVLAKNQDGDFFAVERAKAQKLELGADLTQYGELAYWSNPDGPRIRQDPRRLDYVSARPADFSGFTWSYPEELPEVKEYQLIVSRQPISPHTGDETDIKDFQRVLAGALGKIHVIENYVNAVVDNATEADHYWYFALLAKDPTGGRIQIPMEHHDEPFRKGRPHKNLRGEKSWGIGSDIMEESFKSWRSRRLNGSSDEPEAPEDEPIEEAAEPRSAEPRSYEPPSSEPRSYERPASYEPPSSYERPSSYEPPSAYERPSSYEPPVSSEARTYERPSYDPPAPTPASPEDVIEDAEAVEDVQAEAPYEAVIERDPWAGVRAEISLSLASFTADPSLIGLAVSWSAVHNGPVIALRAERKPKDVENLLSQDSPLPEGCERLCFDGTGITELIDTDCHDFGWYLVATGDGAPIDSLSTRGVYRLLDAPNLYYWHHPEGRAQDRLVHVCELEMSRRRGDWVALEFGAHDIDEPAQLELYRFNTEIDWLKATPEDLEAFHAAQRGEEQDLVDVFGFEGNMVGIRDDVSPERTRVFFGAAVVDQNNNRFNIPVFCLGPEEGNSWPLLSDPFADDEEGVFEEHVVSEGDVGVEEYEPIRFDPNDLDSVMQAAAKVVALTEADEGDEGEPGFEPDVAEYEVRVAGEPRRSRPHPKDLSMDDVLGEVPGRKSARPSPEPPRAATPATPPNPVAPASGPRSEATAGMRAKVASMTLDDVLAGTGVDSRDGVEDEGAEDDDEGVEIRLSLDADSDPDALREQLHGALVDAERRLRSAEPEVEEEELLPALEGDEELEGEQDPVEDDALEDQEAETAEPDPAEIERRADALIAEALASWVPGAQVQLAFPMDGSAGAPEALQAKLKLAMQAKMDALAQAKLAERGDEEMGIVSRSRFVPASELDPPTSDSQGHEEEEEDDEAAINRRGDALIAAALANWKPGDQVRLELPMDGSAGTQGALQAKLHTAMQMKVRAGSRVEEEPEDEFDVDSMLGGGPGTPSLVEDFPEAENSALSEGQEVEHGVPQDGFDFDVDAALGDRYGDDVERFDAEPVDRGFDEEEFPFDLDAALRGEVEASGDSTGSEGVQAFEDEEPEPLLWTTVEQVWHLPRLRWDRPEGAEVSLLWTAASVPPHFDRADLDALLDGTPPHGIRRFDLGELDGIVENLCAVQSFVVVAVRGLDGEWQPLWPKFVDFEDGYDLELLEPEDLAQLDLAVARCVARARRIFSDTPEDLDALYAELDRARSLWRDNVRVLAFARGAGIEL